MHYDPFSATEEVRLYSTTGQFLQVAKRYERERGAHPQPKKQTNETPLDHEYLKLLEERYQQEQQEEAERGVDYHQPKTDKFGRRLNSPPSSPSCWAAREASRV